MIKAVVIHPDTKIKYFILGLYRQDLDVLRGGNLFGLEMDKFGFQPDEPHRLILMYGVDEEEVRRKVSNIKPVPGGGLLLPGPNWDKPEVVN